MPFFRTIAHGACWIIDGDTICNKQPIPKEMPCVGAWRAQGQCPKPSSCSVLSTRHLREVAAAEETRGGQMQQCELEIRFGCEVITLRKNRKMLKSEAACAVEWSRKCNNCRRASRAGLMSTHAAFVTCGQQLRFPLPFPFRQQTVACSGEVSLRCHTRPAYHLPLPHSGFTSNSHTTPSLPLTPRHNTEAQQQRQPHFACKPQLPPLPLPSSRTRRRRNASPLHKTAAAVKSPPSTPTSCQLHTTSSSPAQQASTLPASTALITARVKPATAIRFLRSAAMPAC